MDKTATPSTLTGMMETLAEPTRLRVLGLLEQSELSVVELCRVLQMPQSTVSRHLKTLGDLQWVHNRREGTTNLYRLTLDELEPLARKLWMLAREQVQQWATCQQDRLRLEQVLAQRQRDAQKFFDSAAGEWDQLRTWLYGTKLNAGSLLGLVPEDWTVADLGCGTGTLTGELAGQVKRVIGVDQSQAMLKVARQRLADRDNVELIKSDLAETPMKRGLCDAVMLVLVLSYVEEPAEVLREAGRICRQGGRVVVTDLQEHDREDFRRQWGQQWMGFSADGLETWLREAGFRRVMIRALPPETEAKGPALFTAVGWKE